MRTASIHEAVLELSSESALRLRVRAGSAVALGTLLRSGTEALA
jgi:hypothetical protein